MTMVIVYPSGKMNFMQAKKKKVNLYMKPKFCTFCTYIAINFKNNY